MDLLAVRWPNGTYSVYVPSGVPLPSVEQPTLWVGKGSANPAQQSTKILDNGIRVEGLAEWKWRMPGTIILNVPERTTWEDLEPPLKRWLAEVFGKKVALREVYPN